jgi:hypothetical protein
VDLTVFQNIKQYQYIANSHGMPKTFTYFLKLSRERSNSKIILKCILEEQDVNMWTGLNCTVNCPGLGTLEQHVTRLSDAVK